MASALNRLDSGADRYDEDCPMELVTPKGLMPTPLGRAGRRQVKPVNTFTPMTEVRSARRGMALSRRGGPSVFVSAGEVPAE